MNSITGADLTFCDEGMARIGYSFNGAALPPAFQPPSNHLTLNLPEGLVLDVELYDEHLWHGNVVVLLEGQLIGKVHVYPTFLVEYTHKSLHPTHCGSDDYIGGGTYDTWEDAIAAMCNVFFVNEWMEEQHNAKAD